MDLPPQTDDILAAHIQKQLQLWQRWMKFVRRIEATRPAGIDVDSIASLTALSEQAQEAVDIARSWARLWFDSLEHVTNMTLGNQARISEQLDILAEQARHLHQQARVMDANQAWIRLWIETLAQSNGTATVLIAWNRQIIEHQARARQQFLNAWLMTFEDLDPFDKKGDSPTPQSVETLQDAITKAMTIPFGPAEPGTERDNGPPARQVEDTAYPPDQDTQQTA